MRVKRAVFVKKPKGWNCFFWPALERQIIIKGNAQKISSDRSDEYFNSRPRGSQLGAFSFSTELSNLE